MKRLILSRQRRIFLSGSALLGVLALGLPQPANAACTPAVPTDNQSVNCSGTTSTGLSVSAANVIVYINSGSTLSLPGGTALDFTGASGTAGVQVSGTLNGTTALNFGNNPANLELRNGYSITGNVIAGTATTDRIVLGGATNATFNASLIGTQYTGFESFTKTGSSTWTLTGTGNQNWSVNEGTLQVSSSAPLGSLSLLNGGRLLLNEPTAATQVNFTTPISIGAGGGTITAQGGGNTAYTLSGALTGSGSLTTGGWNKIIFAGDASGYTGTVIVSNNQFQGTGNALAFNIINNATVIMTSDTANSYTHVMSGTGNLVKYGQQALTLTGNNSYSGGTSIEQNALIASQDSNLGSSSGALNIGNATFEYGGSFDMTRNVILHNTASAINTSTYNAALNGIVSGTGRLNKTGSGTLTLAGNNTYQGGTIVSAGTLAVASNTALGTNGLTLNNGTTLRAADNITLNNAVTLGAGTETIDTNGYDLTLGGILSGAGAFTKTGTGSLTLTNTNSYNGATTVSAGSLIINGSNTASATTIAAGATLGGTGTAGTIHNYGTLAPGNSIGTLNVTGDIDFNTGSLYSVEVNAAGGRDLTIASGNITINGGAVRVLAEPGTYANTNTYTILQGNAVSGAFTGVTTDLAFFTPTLIHNSDNVQLSLNRNQANFADVSTDQGQKNVANAVEQLGNGNALYDSFVGLSAHDAVQALDNLSGEHNSGLASATMESSAYVRNMVMGRVQNRSLGTDSGSQNRVALRSANSNNYALNNTALPMLEPAAGGNSAKAENSNFWSEVFGQRGHSDRKGTSPGQQRESGGILVGMDANMDSDWMVGVFGGWETGEIYTNSQFANSDLKTWHAGIYSSYQVNDAWRISGGISGSHHNVETTRHITVGAFDETARGDASGYTISTYLESGYTFDLNAVAVEPFAAVDFTHNKIDGYTETGAGAANLEVDQITQNTPGHTIGVRAAKAIAIDPTHQVNLRGHLGWNHLYGDLSSNTTMQFTTGSTPFTVRGSGAARNSGIVGVGIDADFADDAKLYIGYDGSFSQDSRNHGLTLGVKVKF